MIYLDLHGNNQNKCVQTKLPKIILRLIISPDTQMVVKLFFLMEEHSALHAIDQEEQQIFKYSNNVDIIYNHRSYRNRCFHW